MTSLRPVDYAQWPTPMLATLTDERFTDPDWLFECRLDGVRTIVVCAGADGPKLARQFSENGYGLLINVEDAGIDTMAGELATHSTEVRAVLADLSQRRWCRAALHAPRHGRTGRGPAGRRRPTP